MARIAIVGGGASGTLLALWLLRHAPGGTHVSLVEPGDAPGRGVAYGTADGCHRLNVPAGKMSAFAEEAPDHFLQWLRGGLPGRGAVPMAEATAETFVPRRTYGRYLSDTLRHECRRRPATLEHLRGQATGVHADAKGLRVEHSAGAPVHADAVVLATGYAAPKTPPPLAALQGDAAYVADPWATSALKGIDPEAPVLVVGTGLTMVDVVLSLRAQGHAAPIHALSRRGQLPARHLAPSASEEDSWTLSDAFSNALPEAGALTALLRDEIDRARAQGVGWRAVIGALRPHTQALWQALPLEEKRRFLRHLRPYWDTARHRMAPECADAIEAMQARGDLMVRAGRIASARRAGPLVRVRWQPRGSEHSETLRVGAVVNGTGRSACRTGDPLWQHLLEQRVACTDATGLGLATDAGGALVGPDGAVSKQVFAIGPPRAGTLWESTSIREIRMQARALATRLLSNDLDADQAAQEARGAEPARPAVARAA